MNKWVYNTIDKTIIPVNIIRDYLDNYIGYESKGTNLSVSFPKALGILPEFLYDTYEECKAKTLEKLKQELNNNNAIIKFLREELQVRKIMIVEMSVEITNLEKWSKNVEH